MTEPVLVPETAARRALAADLGHVQALARQARVAVADARGGPLWSTRDALPEPLALEKLLDDPGALVAVGTLDEHVVGYLIGVVETLHDRRKLARVIELYVEEGARQLGIGEAILDLALAWAGAAGCIGIDAAALPGDRDTKNFFETAGLVARAIVVHRALGRDAS